MEVSEVKVWSRLKWNLKKKQLDKLGMRSCAAVSMGTLDIAAFLLSVRLTNATEKMRIASLLWLPRKGCFSQLSV